MATLTVCISFLGIGLVISHESRFPRCFSFTLACLLHLFNLLIELFHLHCLLLDY